MSQDVADPGLLPLVAPGCAAPVVPARWHPKVLLVTESLEPSGVGEHMITLAAALRRSAQVILAFAATAGGKVLAERAHNRGLTSFTLPVAAMRDGDVEFAAALDRYRPDIVHVHAGIGWEGHRLAAAARRRTGCAILRTEHLPYTLRELGDRALEAAYAEGVRHVDHIICVCEAARRTFRMSGVDGKRFSVVYNGIDPRQPVAPPGEVRRALGTGDARLILTVGRLTDQKRHRTLLNALPALLAHHDACLAWVGTGPLEAALRARAHALGVAARVLFLGQRDDVPALMAAADLLCLPSYFEGHPLVILEAMAAGLPVVAARSLGITETVCNGETGLLFPLDNAPVLAHTLARLLDDRQLAARLAAAARLVVRRHFTARRMAGQTLAVYRAVLATKRVRAPARLVM